MSPATPLTRSVLPVSTSHPLLDLAAVFVVCWLLSAVIGAWV